ncbi:MAG: hypothetical protein NTX75_04160 [Proteobacteria bacterium]|nr:hypothetical protein [Pseudomonadota bacterium]
MELIATITNTILLILIFWYQINKNKVLSGRIVEQSNLLRETKDVVLQQAQAIDSQKKVVDTALEYSKVFDVGKLETMIKREVELDYKQQMQEKEQDYKKRTKGMQVTDKVLEEVVISATTLTAEKIAEQYVGPLAVELVMLLGDASPEKRKHALSRIPLSISDTIASALDKLDQAKLKGFGIGVL